MTDTFEANETQSDTARVPMKAPMPTGASIAPLIPRSFEDVWRIAQMAAKANLLSKEMATAERAAIAIMHGMEIGLPPMMALQRIAVINNRPSLWGDAVPAVAISTRQLVDWSERFEGQGDDLAAVCLITRRTGNGAVLTKEAKFSVADAKAAGLWDDRVKVKRRGKDGNSYETDNDSPWHCYPRRMLTMRARVAFRDLFADAFCGLYIAEELIGGPDTGSSVPFARIDNPLADEPLTRRDGVETVEASTVASSPAAVQPTQTDAPRPDNGIPDFLQREKPTEGAAATNGSGAKKPGRPRLTEEEKAARAAAKVAKEMPLASDAADRGDSPPQFPEGNVTAVEITQRVGAVSETVRQEYAKPVETINPETGEVTESASPQSNGADEFPQPYIKQSAETYSAYARKWLNTAFEEGWPPKVVEDRWTKEREIRNGLGDPFNAVQWNELKNVYSQTMAQLQ